MKNHLIAISMILVLSPIMVIACGCPGPGSLNSNPQKYATERKAESAAVFSGKVLSIEEKGDGLVMATFSITTSWKGIRSKQTNIYYYHGRETSCFYSLIMGEEDTFFAWRANGRYFVGICSHGKGLEPYLGKPLKLRS